MLDIRRMTLTFNVIFFIFKISIQKLVEETPWRLLRKKTYIVISILQYDFRMFIQGSVWNPPVSTLA